VKPTGETILFNNASDYMAINELTGFAWTFLIIGVIHALLFMSVTAGVLSLIPNVVPILFNYGLMGLLGIPLNTGNALIATIAIGIAVDDTVHHMVTYNRQLNIHDDQKIAMFNTMRSQGRPIIYVSLALGAGFLALAFSNFVPTVQFGWLAAGVMLLAMASELMLLGRLDSVPAGEFVVRKGERGTEMYMVVSGRVRVSDRLADGTEKVLTQLGPGAVSFERIRRRFPFTGAELFRNLARVLALRLRHTTAMLVEGHPLAVVPSSAERA
jgi:hypothetical protein